MLPQKTILITGGLGFIGSHALRYFLDAYPLYHFLNVDNLSYAASLDNLSPSYNTRKNYQFIQADIRDERKIQRIFQAYPIDTVLHFAAESHVDSSLLRPMDFVQTNIAGTAILLNAALHQWEGRYDNKVFYHISTDEVYGSLQINDAPFTETTAYAPRSPYAASKAASDHLVQAYAHTYGLPVLLSNCSNNYGPYQFPEKFIPLIIEHIKQKKAIPIYGKGDNIRDWIWVGDHIRAIDLILHKGEKGKKYNIGGNDEVRNIDMVHQIGKIIDAQLGRDEGNYKQYISFVADRKGHDFRYAIDSSLLQHTLGWQAQCTRCEGLKITVEWYLNNEKWVKNALKKISP